MSSFIFNAFYCVSYLLKSILKKSLMRVVLLWCQFVNHVFLTCTRFYSPKISGLPDANPPKVQNRTLFAQFFGRPRCGSKAAAHKMYTLQHLFFAKNSRVKIRGGYPHHKAFKYIYG